jgi:hypothetical protein
MAGRVQRMSTPKVTPSVKAKAAYPIGATPRASNTRGENRLSWPMVTGNPPAWSIGPTRQVTMRLSSPAVAMAARPVCEHEGALKPRRVRHRRRSAASVPAEARIDHGSPVRATSVEIG